MKKLSLLGKISAFVILSIAFTACQKDDIPEDNRLGITFYALAGNRLDKISTSNPKKVISSATITGLPSGVKIVGMDFRPATGQLYALTNNSFLYTINPSTGMTTFVQRLLTNTGGTFSPYLLMGTSFGFDFNPVVDRIRIVSNTGQNLRVNPMTGETIVDGSINPQPASVNGVAYDNNDQDPATTTELYALDPSRDLLFEIDPPNNGTLIEPRSIRLDITGDGGFDIAPRNVNVTTDIGLALYEVNNKPTLFKIDVETGETKILAKYDKNVMYSGIAISPVAETTGHH